MVTFSLYLENEIGEKKEEKMEYTYVMKTLDTYFEDEKNATYTLVQSDNSIKKGKKVVVGTKSGVIFGEVVQEASEYLKNKYSVEGIAMYSFKEDCPLEDAINHAKVLNRLQGK